MLLFKKINNTDLWEKIQKLREFIKLIKNFKERRCWNCGKELNIYDFMSDNLEFTPEYILRLWQTSILEFHCCECFKNLKSLELKRIELRLKSRNCLNCSKEIDIYSFSKYHNYLKISELRALWLDNNFKIFCDRLCQRKYYKIKGISPTRMKEKN